MAEMASAASGDGSSPYPDHAPCVLQQSAGRNIEAVSTRSCSNDAIHTATQGKLSNARGNNLGHEVFSHLKRGCSTTVLWVHDLQYTRFDKQFCILLLLVEAFISFSIITLVPYTEIDWETYMQQVNTFLSGERNYYNIKGNTGPLVYPAGFLYFFSMLRFITKENVWGAQVIFTGVYLTQLAIILLILEATFDKDTWLLAAVILSKRLHSIYLLRCFNDGVAMTFAFAAVLAAQRQRWTLCCLLFSLGVSIKMNVLLMAPALLWLLWECASSRHLDGLVKYLGLCACLQVILALPFLANNPLAYLHRAFEVSRVFQHQWTVNFRFLPEWIFVSPLWASFLLMGHLLTLHVLWKRTWIRNRTVVLSNDIYRTYVTFVFFSCNFVGILFARSLHYQFYSWYFPTMPFLLNHCSKYSRPIKLLALLALECCWNVYPQKSAVSLLLLAIHVTIMVGLIKSPLKDLWRREFTSVNNTAPNLSGGRDTICAGPTRSAKYE